MNEAREIARIVSPTTAIAKKPSTADGVAETLVRTSAAVAGVPIVTPTPSFQRNSSQIRLKFWIFPSKDSKLRSNSR